VIRGIDPYQQTTASMPVFICYYRGEIMIPNPGDLLWCVNGNEGKTKTGKLYIYVSPLRGDFKLFVLKGVSGGWYDYRFINLSAIFPEDDLTYIRELAERSIEWDTKKSKESL
jgi:hypothetical protein